MLTHPTLDQLGQLGLPGMAQAFTELEASGEAAALSHTDWLSLLLDRELTHRRDKRLAARLRYARLRQQAAVEDVDYRAPRGLDRTLFRNLANGEWIDAHDNLILCGPTGVGKSWLACALGHKACRDNRSVLYQRVPKLFTELARGDGRYARILRSLTGVQLLILDDWGLEPSMPVPVVTSMKSSRNVMGAAQPSSPAKSPLTNGMFSSGTRPMPTPFSTASSTTPTVSTSPARVSDADAPDRCRRIDHQPATLPKPIVSRAPASQATSFRIAGRHHLGISGRHRRNPHTAHYRSPRMKKRRGIQHRYRRVRWIERTQTCLCRSGHLPR